MSIPDSDVTHFIEGDVLQSELQVIRSREFILPSQSISYSEGDKVKSNLSFFLKNIYNLESIITLLQIEFSLFDGAIISGLVEDCFLRYY